MYNLEKELVKFKHAELNCLGIAPKLYYSAAKLLDRHIITVLKDNILYQFVNETNPELIYDSIPKNEWSNSTDKRYSYQKAIMLIEETFGINEILAGKIVNEWRRNKIIMHNMYAKPSKYWRYISLPNETEDF